MNSSHVLPLHSTSPDASQGASRRHRCAPGETATDAQYDDLQLVARLVEREPSAWREFLQQYERLIYSRVLSAYHELGREPQPDVVEDCCAEVLSALFHNDLKALRQFQGRSRLSTWLAVVSRRVAINVIVHRLREADQQKSDSQFDLNAVVAPQVKTSLSGELDCNEVVMRLCLQKLSAADQQVLHCIFDQGMSYEQTARELGISTNAVGPKLQRAQLRLKKLVQSYRTTKSNSDET